MTSTRGLKAGDLVTVPASYQFPGLGRKQAVVEAVSLNGLSFSDTKGTRHFTADAELVPLTAAAGAPTRRQALGFAGKLAAAAAETTDTDTACTLVDLVADLVNHANGHPVPWLTRP
jgi:hypothetical protein